MNLMRLEELELFGKLEVKMRILSGVRAGMDRQKYDASSNYISNLLNKLQHVHDYEPSGHRYDPVDVEACMPAWKEFQKIAKLAGEAEKKIAEVRKALNKEYGVYEAEITEEKQVLGLLPPHRITTASVEDRQAYWRIAFKPALFPAHAKHLDLEEGRIWAALYGKLDFCDKPNPKYDRAAAAEDADLKKRLKPLVDLGFDCTCTIVKITKTNIIANVRISARQ